jgi:hypothetical protein
MNNGELDRLNKELSVENVRLLRRCRDLESEIVLLRLELKRLQRMNG